jgi:hypothetical protein
LASRRRRSGGRSAFQVIAEHGIMLSTIKELWKKVLALIQLETLTLDSMANDFRKGVTT